MSDAEGLMMNEYTTPPTTFKEARKYLSDHGYTIVKTKHCGYKVYVKYHPNGPCIFDMDIDDAIDRAKGINS